jgi:23S rRNA pseudouridine1911/1915/1917 synthase
MSFDNLLDILYEDNHCLAIAKPSGALSTHYQGGEETLDRVVKRYLKEKHGKPGNVFLGIVHRLDRPVSGPRCRARGKPSGSDCPPSSPPARWTSYERR